MLIIATLFIPGKKNLWVCFILENTRLKTTTKPYKLSANDFNILNIYIKIVQIY